MCFVDGGEPQSSIKDGPDRLVVKFYCTVPFQPTQQICGGPRFGVGDAREAPLNGGRSDDLQATRPDATRRRNEHQKAFGGVSLTVWGA